MGKNLLLSIFHYFRVTLLISHILWKIILAQFFSKSLSGGQLAKILGECYFHHKFLFNPLPVLCHNFSQKISACIIFIKVQIEKNTSVVAKLAITHCLLHHTYWKSAMLHCLKKKQLFKTKKALKKLSNIGKI